MRKLAQATGIAKSSVDRHRQALQERSVVAEAVFWEQALGQDWLHRLVFAIIYVFGIKGGMGADRLSEFFHCVHLVCHVGCSASALHRLRAEFETTLLAYPPEQLRSLAAVYGELLFTPQWVNHTVRGNAVASGNGADQRV